MTARRRSMALALGIMTLAAPAIRGQDRQANVPRSAGECPVVGGVSASVVVRDSAGAAPRDLVRIDRRATLDTTFTFHVAERRWAVAAMAASAAIGAADTVTRKWYLCAGAGVGLERPTLVIRGARGHVRLRASFAELARALGSRTSQPDPTRTPPRRS